MIGLFSISGMGLSTTFGRRAFSVTGPTVWNSLSNTLREQSDEDSFKRQLKTFLFSRTLGLAYPCLLYTSDAADE